MNASEYGPACWQAGFDGQVTLQGQGPIVKFPAYTIQSEHCLVTDINAPAGSCEGSNLPVMIWIHGEGGVLPVCAVFASTALGSCFHLWVPTHTGYVFGTAGPGARL